MLLWSWIVLLWFWIENTKIFFYMVLTKHNIAYMILPETTKEGGCGMKEMERMEELELEGFGLGIPRPKHDGERILRRHMYLTSRFTATIAVKDATPYTRRLLNYNNGSCPESIFRIFCTECRKMRTIIVYPTRTEVEFKASCCHVLEKAVEMAKEDGTLVYIGRYRIVPIGIVGLVSAKVLG